MSGLLILSTIVRTLFQMGLIAAGLFFLLAGFGVIGPHFLGSAVGSSVVPLVRLGEFEFYNLPAGAFIGIALLVVALLIPRFWRIAYEERAADGSLRSATLMIDIPPED